MYVQVALHTHTCVCRALFLSVHIHTALSPAAALDKQEFMYLQVESPYIHTTH